ncbi:MAG: hypothetical protein HFACDABA_02708 [Anaerolineales bacterium]|nr:hypothetical protein [Anaerolineales bacterium]
MHKRLIPNKHERGQSLVEFAISLIPILILLAGAVDFGIGLFHYTTMRDAAQEGALFGSMNPDNTAGITGRVVGAAGAGELIDRLYDGGNGPLEIIISYSGAHCEGNSITVSIQYDYPLSMPLISAFVGETIPLQAIATDTILSPVCP